MMAGQERNIEISLLIENVLERLLGWPVVAAARGWKCGRAPGDPNWAPGVKLD
jgi:hypothetical protein